MSTAEFHYTGGHRYEHTDDEIKAMTAQLLREKSPGEQTGTVCYRLEGNDQYADIAREIESRVFNQEFHNTPDIMESEYSLYDDSSTFFLAVDTEREKPVGVLRVIANSNAGLKTLNDIEMIGETYPESGLNGVDIDTVRETYSIDDLNKCWDIGTVAIPREERHSSTSQDTSLLLYRAMYVAAKSEGIDHLVSVIAPKAHNILTKYLGIPFETLCDSKPFDYLDARDSQVVYGHVPDFYSKMNRKRLTTVHGFLARNALKKLVKGVGVDEKLLFDYKK